MPDDEKTPISTDVYEWSENLKDELLEKYGVSIKMLTESDDPVDLVIAAGMGEATLRAKIAEEQSPFFCPVCGDGELIAVCKVDVEYVIEDDGEGGQDWVRTHVDDDASDPSYFRCRSCRNEWHTFELTDDGYLESLGKPDPSA